MSLLKCGLIAAKISEIDNFWYKFAKKRYTPVSDFLNKIWLGRESLMVRTLMPNFTVLALKCGPTDSDSQFLV